MGIGLAVVGLLALVGVGAMVVRAVSGGGGGASSPEGAVQALADSVSSEDPVAAASILAPDEVRSLGSLLDDVEQQASESGFASPESSFAGVDVTVEGLELDVDELGDDVARVTIRHGSAAYELDRTKLGDRTQALIDEDTSPSESIDVSDIADDDMLGDDPFIMVVRRDGGWYVSLTYTAAEYAAEHFDLPEGEFDSDRDLGEPEADPEAAVEQLVESGGTLDPTETAAQLPQDEWRALVAYEDAITEYIEGNADEEFSVSDVEVEVDSSDLKVEDASGGTKKVVIEGADGSVSWTDEGEAREEEWEVEGWCLTVTDQYGGEGDPGCLIDEDSFIGAAIGIGDPYVVTIEERGGWVVSPMSTVIQMGREILPNLTPDLVLTMLGRSELVTPSGTVTVGQELDVTLGDSGVATYELVPDEDVEVLIDVVDDGDSYVDTRITDLAGEYPGGRWGTELEAGESYRLVAERQEREGGKSASLVIGRVVSGDLPATAFSDGLTGALTAEEPVRRYRFSPSADAQYELNVAGDVDVSIDGDSYCSEGDSCDFVGGAEYLLTVSRPDSGGGSDEFEVTFEESSGYSIDGSTTTGGVLDEGSSAYHDLIVDSDSSVTVIVTADDGSSDFDVRVGGESFAAVGGEESFTVSGPFEGTMEVYLYSSSSSRAGYTITIDEGG